MATLSSVGKNNYRYYKKSIDTLGNASKRLSSGKKLAAIDSNSDIMIGNARRAYAKGNDAILEASYHAGKAVVSIQESIASKAVDLASRLYELAAVSQSSTLTDAEIASLGAEANALITMATQLAVSAPLIGTLTPHNTVSLNTGISAAGTVETLVINASETILGQAATLGNFTDVLACGGTSLTSAAIGAQFLARFSLTDISAASGNPLLLANALSAKAAKNLTALNHMYDVHAARSAEIDLQADELTDIDPISESAEFSKASVQLNTAQIMQSQANNLLSTVNRFLQNL